MLKKEILDLLNTQINMEFYSSNLYLQMGAWCDAQGLSGCGTFLKEHAAEEMMHMRKIFDYVAESGAVPVLGTIEAPATDYKSVTAMFEEIYEHEQMISEKINVMTRKAFEAADMMTFNFLQWFVAEQHEEEDLFSSVLDKVKMIGEDGKGLYFIDKEVLLIHNEVEAAEAAGE